MNQEESENLIRDIFPNVVIMPSSCRSDYKTDEDYDMGMKKHKEIAEIIKIWNADKEQKEDW